MSLLSHFLLFGLTPKVTFESLFGYSISFSASGLQAGRWLDPECPWQIPKKYCGGGLNIGNKETQLLGTQFDRITTRYEYCEVLSPPAVYFNREFPYAGCLLELGTKVVCLLVFVTNFNYKLTIFGLNINLYSAFSEFGGCHGTFVSYFMQQFCIHSRILSSPPETLF